MWLLQVWRWGAAGRVHFLQRFPVVKTNFDIPPHK